MPTRIIIIHYNNEIKSYLQQYKYFMKIINTQFHFKVCWDEAMLILEGLVYRTSVLSYRNLWIGTLLGSNMLSTPHAITWSMAANMLLVCLQCTIYLYVIILILCIFTICVYCEVYNTTVINNQVLNKTKLWLEFRHERGV